MTSRWGKSFAAMLAIWVAMAGAAGAQSLNTLADFDGANGNSPFYGSLIQSPEGNFFGSDEHGGVNACGFNNGCGTVFEISPTGTLKSLYSFCPPSGCVTGNLPLAGPVLATDGNLYGTAWYGGASGYPCGGSLGCGVIYKIAKGTVSTFYSFCAQLNCADGGFPYGALIEGIDANLYGSTAAYGPYGGGTVFKITPAGLLTVLYAFCRQTGCTDGEYPNTGVIQGKDGNFYGTTYYGGTNGWGTVYKLTPAGTLTTLHSFAGTPTEGGYPTAGLVQGADGNFYGTTMHGGNSSCFEGCGTIFKINSKGVLTTLHTFAGPEGDDPTAPLILATDGEFYGTTAGGGNYGGGTIFKISSAGALETLYNFCEQTGCADGAGPWGGLLQATSGIFYGTTSAGGSSLSCPGCGTVFSFNAGLSPFASFVLAAGKVGHTVEVLGQGFTGATNASVNNISASFTVVSDTFLRLTIPAGATGGYVTVTTPGGTLTSNVRLRVIP